MSGTYFSTVGYHGFGELSQIPQSALGYESKTNLSESGIVSPNLAEDCKLYLDIVFRLGSLSDPLFFRILR